MNLKTTTTAMLLMWVQTVFAQPAAEPQPLSNVCAPQQFSRAESLYQQAYAADQRDDIVTAADLLGRAERRCAIAGIQIPLAVAYLQQGRWLDARKVLARMSQSGQLLSEQQLSEYYAGMAQSYLGQYQQSIEARPQKSYPVASLCPVNPRFPAASRQNCGQLQNALMMWRQMQQHQPDGQERPQWVVELEQRLRQASQDYSWTEQDIAMLDRSLRSNGLQSSFNLPIHFATDDSGLNANGLHETEAVERFLRDQRRQQRFVVQLRGHADRRGTEAYNDRLSERRAQTVKRKLLDDMSWDLPVQVVAMGEYEPECLSDDPHCWARNRRVEIRLLPKR